MNQFPSLGTAPIEKAAFSSSNEPSVFLHLAIFLGDQANTILGDEIFRLVSFQGTETISEPFEYTLELHANDQWPPLTGPVEGGWTFDQLLGRGITFAVSLPQPPAPLWTDIEVSSRQFRDAIAGGEVPAGLSFFNGIVADIDMAEPGIYHITVKPALWQLTLANRYAVLRDCSIGDALSRTLQRYGASADFSALDDTATTRAQDWLQAGESDYEFLQRLMGKAGLFYYFRQSPTGHTVVFGNTPSYPDQVLAGRQFRYVYVDAAELGLAQWDAIVGLRYRQSLGIAAVNARFVEEYQAWQGDEVMWQHPLAGYSAAAGAEQGQANLFNLHKIFQIDCDNGLTGELADKAWQSSRASTGKLSGQAFCAAFRIGYRFGVTAQTWAYDQYTNASVQVPVRPQLDARAFVLTKVEHQASMDGGYRNSFEATVTDGLVSPFSLGDTQQGVVLAVVVDQDDDAQASSSYYQCRDDFDPAIGDYAIEDGEGDGQVQGAYVILAPDWPSGPQVFVKLSANLSSVPSVGSLVQVARSSDETELPELQQVVFQGGMKTVTPTGWTASTSIGNAYGTHYGDGLNINYGLKSQPDLGGAVQIVSNAYGASLPGAPAASGGATAAPATASPPAPQGDLYAPSSADGSGLFKDASFNQGASYGFSTSEANAATAIQDFTQTFAGYGNQATDLLSVNESFGSTFGRSAGNVQSNLSNYQVGYSNSTFGTSWNYTTINETSTTVATHNGTVSNTTTINAPSNTVTTHNGVVTTLTVINAASDTTTLNNGDVSTVSTVEGTSTTTTTHNDDVSNNTTFNEDCSNTTNHNGDVTNETTILGNSKNENLVFGINESFNFSTVSADTHIVGASASMKLTGTWAEIDIRGPGYEYKWNPEQLKMESQDTEIQMPVLVLIIL